MDKLEIHFYLENNLHSMDAFVKNKAEAELLKLLKEVSEILSIELDFEVEALKPGGIKELLRILNKKKNKKIYVPILTFLGGILSTIIIDYANTDHELNSLKKEELKLRIEQLKKELNESKLEDKDQGVKIESLIILIQNTDKIRLHRSNFYRTLLNEPKVEKLSTTELDVDSKPVSAEKIISRSDFQKFIIESIEVEPDYLEGVQIEIISPVLISGKYKWKGLYNNKIISFDLLDPDFKQSVINKEYSFSNGTGITCDLEIEKTMDNDGVIKEKEYKVYNVDNVYEGTTITETKSSKKKKDIDNQMNLPF